MKHPEHLIVDDFGVDMPKITCEKEIWEEFEKEMLGLTEVEYSQMKIKEKIKNIRRKIKDKMMIKLTTEAQKVKTRNSMFIKF